MVKYLVTIEFRYTGKPCDIGATHKNKTITLGVFDSYQDACNDGNKAMEVFEKHFKLNTNYNNKERFNLKNSLISDLTYLKTPFSFFAKIIKLNYDDTEKTILNVLNEIEEYRKHRFEITE